ncbi:MAG: hypothetical protein R6X12_10330 [bacterium]
MKKFLFLLTLPLVLSAQVEVDTVIDLARLLFNGHYVPELNKLYLMASDRLIVLDCSTWQKTAEFVTGSFGSAEFAWNPLRRKLYATFQTFYPEDDDGRMLVIYADADTARWISTECKSIDYVASKDQLYGAPFSVGGQPGRVIMVWDCETDAVVKVIPSPVGLEPSKVTWDSVADRVYTSWSSWGAPVYMSVHDVATDSLLALFRLGCAPPNKLAFHHPSRTAYFVSDEGFSVSSRAGVIDTDRMRLICLFPFEAYGHGNDGRGPVAVNTLMDKVYIGGNENNFLCTLFIFDAAPRDSTARTTRRIGYRGRGSERYVVWVPWSNRVYFEARADRWSHLAVLDCETDSVIIPELYLPGQRWSPYSIQLDPVRERIFAIGADTTAIHVLRDLPSGIAEGRGPGPRSVPALAISPNPARNLLRLSGAESVGLYAPDGRRVLLLRPGENDVRHLLSGVYFVREAPGAGREAGGITKVVIAR